MKSLIIVACIGLAFALAGCSGKEALPDGPALKAFTEKARDDAATAQTAGDPKSARRAAGRAVVARDKAEKLAAGAKDDPAAQELAKQVRAAARDAAGLADLADEEKALTGKVGSLKGRAYRAARAGALKVVFTGLALAAEHAGSAGYNTLGPDERKAADLASSLAGDLKLADGTPDWKAIGAKIASFGSQPPPEVACILAVAFLVLQYDGLALLEADCVRFPETAPAPERAVGHVARGFAFRLNGFPQMAKREFEAVKADGGESAGLADPQLQAAVYLVAACSAAQERDFEEADRDIMRALKVCPNNPFAVYLTGEVQVAEGEYEKAEVTFGEILGTPGVDIDPWLVDRIQRRARAIRDARGEVEPLVFNSGFLREIAIHYVWQAAKTSKPAAAVKGWVESAKSLGSEVLKYVPGGAAEKE